MELRHAISHHASIPTLSQLTEGAHHAWDWLQLHYWQAQAQAVGLVSSLPVPVPSPAALAPLLGAYRRASKDEMRAKLEMRTRAETRLKGRVTKEELRAKEDAASAFTRRRAAAEGIHSLMTRLVQAPLGAEGGDYLDALVGHLVPLPVYSPSTHPFLIAAVSGVSGCSPVVYNVPGVSSSSVSPTPSGRLLASPWLTVFPATRPPRTRMLLLSAPAGSIGC